MLHFAHNLNNPLLQLVLCISEPVIRAACDNADPLLIHAEMSQSPDGRDFIHIRLQALSAIADFHILLANYFLTPRLYRVVRHAWFTRSRNRCLPPFAESAPHEHLAPAPAALN